MLARIAVSKLTVISEIRLGGFGWGFSVLKKTLILGINIKNTENNAAIKSRLTNANNSE
jgi:hypothetical protein